MGREGYRPRTVSTEVCLELEDKSFMSHCRRGERDFVVKLSSRRIPSTGDFNHVSP